MKRLIPLFAWAMLIMAVVPQISTLLAQAPAVTVYIQTMQAPFGTVVFLYGSPDSVTGYNVTAHLPTKEIEQRYCPKLWPFTMCPVSALAISVDVQPITAVGSVVTVEVR